MCVETTEAEISKKNRRVTESADKARIYIHIHTYKIKPGPAKPFAHEVQSVND